MASYSTDQIRGMIQGSGPPNSGPTARDPRLVPLSTVYYDDTPVTGGVWQCSLNAVGQPAWIPLVPPAASQALGKYVVHVAGTVPASPYTDPNDAIAAAVADLHDASNPAVVQVLSGSYAPAGGVVALPPGISLVAMAGGGGDFDEDSPDVRMAAGLVFTGAAASRHTVTGIRWIAPLGTPALQVLGAADLLIGMRQCQFETTLGPTMRFLNTGPNTSIALLNGAAFCEDPDLSQPTVETQVAFLRFVRCELGAPPFTRTTTVARVGSVGMVTCLHTGGFVLGDVATAATVSLDGTAANGNVLVTTTNPNDYFRADGGQLFATANPGFVGPGQVSIVDVPVIEGGVYRTAPSVVTYPVPVIRQANHVHLAASGAYPDATALLTIDGTTSPSVQLRALTSYFDGETLEVKSTSTVGVVSVVPDPIDQIDNLGVGVSFPIAAGDSKRFRVDRVLGRWWSLG